MLREGLNGACLVTESSVASAEMTIQTDSRQVNGFHLSGAVMF
jgi:hypothetical protein